MPGKLRSSAGQSQALHLLLPDACESHAVTPRGCRAGVLTGGACVAKRALTAPALPQTAFCHTPAANELELPPCTREDRWLELSSVETLCYNEVGEGLPVWQRMRWSCRPLPCGSLAAWRPYAACGWNVARHLALCLAQASRACQHVCTCPQPGRLLACLLCACAPARCSRPQRPPIPRPSRSPSASSATPRTRSRSTRERRSVDSGPSTQRLWAAPWPPSRRCARAAATRRQGPR